MTSGNCYLWNPGCLQKRTLAKLISLSYLVSLTNDFFDSDRLACPILRIRMLSLVVICMTVCGKLSP